MLQFYKRATLIFVVLLALSLLAAYFCVNRSFLYEELIPVQNSAFPWKVVPESDAAQGGTSTVSINESTYALDYNFRKTMDYKHPYASLKLIFVNKDNQQQWVDLSKFTDVSFKVRCSPHNVLTFMLITLDDALTKREKKDIFRTGNAFFSCDEAWHKIELDLNRFEASDWWLNKYNLELSNRDYQLDKVNGFLIGTSTQTQNDTDSNVKVSEFTLKGRDWRLMYTLGIMMIFVWSAYVYWFFIQYGRSLKVDIKNKMLKDRPLIAYQQLSIESQNDKEKEIVLRFMVTEYANPDLNLEYAIGKLGVSRAKINDVLKEELGYTFIAFVNKLRLAEAARLLSDQNAANIAEIAYSVGYKNVPYFNRLFKSEYGCAPKTFERVYKK